MSYKVAKLVFILDGTVGKKFQKKLKCREKTFSSKTETGDFVKTILNGAGVEKRKINEFCNIFFHFKTQCGRNTSQNLSDMYYLISFFIKTLIKQTM